MFVCLFCVVIGDLFGAVDEIGGVDKAIVWCVALICGFVNYYDLCWLRWVCLELIVNIVADFFVLRWMLFG